MRKERKGKHHLNLKQRGRKSSKPYNLRKEKRGVHPHGLTLKGKKKKPRDTTSCEEKKSPVPTKDMPVKLRRVKERKKRSTAPHD